MRKTSLLLLFIALCTTLIIPVSALMSNVTFTGKVTWTGVASGRDSKNCIEVKVYSKKPLPFPIVFTDDWPIPIAGPHNDIELFIYINKKNNVVKMNCAWGEYKNPSINKYVLKARGTATSIKDTGVEITIEKIEILERVRPNSFNVVVPETGVSIDFSILFI